MRPGRGLGMVLHGEERELSVANPFDSSVVQIQVRHLERRRTGNAVLVANHREPMVLGGDEHLIVPNVAHWVISASMPVRHLGSGAAVGKSYQLVSEAYTEGGEPGP